MNLFDNQKYYSKEEFDKISYEDQQEIFLRIRAWMPRVTGKDRYNSEKFKNIIINRIEQICAYACSGHIPSQDYMGYIYKRGYGDIFPINYKRSIEWSIIAARNGSKLAPQRMRAFMNPAVDMIMSSPRAGQIVKYNELNLSNYFWFLSQYVCELLYVDLQLDPVEMSKKELIEEDQNEKKARIFFDRFRDRCVNGAIDNLIKKLPEDIKEDDEGEELKPKEEKDEKAEDFHFEGINIEDIDEDE